MSTYNLLYKNFQKFTKECHLPTVGTEGEYILVSEKGKPGDIRKMFDIMKGLGWTPLFTKDNEGRALVKGFLDEKSGISVNTEAGFSTIEINSPPYSTLHEMAINLEDFMCQITRIAKNTGQYVLGYGIQPVRIPTIYDWFPSARYLALREELKRWDPKTSDILRILDVDEKFFRLFSTGVDTVTSTASIQTHTLMKSKEEAVAILNLFNLLTPFFISLYANSPVYGGRVGKVMASREALWHSVHPIQVGLYNNKITSFEDLVSLYMEAHVIIRPNGNEFKAVHKMLKDVNPEFLDQELLQIVRGTFWKVARITKDACIEFRVCCQQIPDKDLSVSSIIEIVGMALGIANNYHAMFEILKKYDVTVLNVRHLYIQAIQKGQTLFTQDTLFQEVTKAMIEIAYDGLKKRGQTEEIYLDKLLGISLYKKGNQEHPVIQAFKQNGLKGLIDLCRFKL